MTSGADAWLVDDRWGKAYPLAEETTIGRGRKCEIIVRDPAVSRTHAVVNRRGVDYVLHAIGSSATNLNGTRVSTDVLLQEGDVVEIAFTSLRFTMRAPTGEMFIVSRDHPTQRDQQESPTRPTLHAMHPITLYSRWRPYWHFFLALLLTIAVLGLCAAR